MIQERIDCASIGKGFWTLSVFCLFNFESRYDFGLIFEICFSISDT